ncbi:Photosystem I assembly protein Ycf3 [bacterium HR37]|jgi:tetratricopeptide (TPR) repeat protein|nr:Photosystem I assembly protein Ycf3 [bacterium HR37]
MSEKDRLLLAIEYFQKAYEYQMSGELDLAIEYYKKSIETYPTAEAYTFLGWTYSFQGRLIEAIAQCKKAIEIDPDFGNPYNDIGAYLIELGKYDEAIPWLEKAIQAKRYEPRHYPHFNLGRVYLIKGMIKKALEEFNKALELCPEYELAKEAIRKLKFTLN